MEELLLVLPIFLFGAFIGSMTGIVLTKWPAKTALTSSLKGAVVAVGVMFVAMLFLSLISLGLLEAYFSDGGPSS